MKNEFISYEQALALKELAFDEPCLKTSWDFDITDKVNVPLPLYQQAFRWFRENHGLDFYIKEHFPVNAGSINHRMWKIVIRQKTIPEVYHTYEEAELDCLNRLIEIAIKNKT